MQNNNKILGWFLGAGIIMVCVGAMTFLNFGDNMVYFFTPSEIKVRDFPSTVVRVGGLVKPGSIEYQEGNLKFILTDGKGVDVKVFCVCEVPDLFKENQGAVIEGRVHEDGFVATKIMVKHSEEYKTPEDKHSIEKALLMDAINK